jgi:tRNA(Ile)-lysidine synthase
MSGERPEGWDEQKADMSAEHSASSPLPPCLAFEHKLAAAWPPVQWQDMTLLVAVSGGADSVALLRGLAAIRLPGAGRIIVGHFNHGWRGAESDADEQFVRALAGRLGLSVKVGRGATASLPLPKVEGTRLTEAAARQARYDFLESTAAGLGARYLVTAHTADDQAETILQRVLRGTGLLGLAGMRRARPLGPAVTLLRPLLEFRRAELVGYLKVHRQEFRQDSSNADQGFTRNRIRHELLPLVAEHYYPGVVQSLLRLGTLAAEAQEVIDHRTIELAERCVTADDSRVRIDCSALGSQPRHLVREVILAAWRARGWPMAAMGFAEWELLARMTIEDNPPVSPKMLPGEVHARREGPCLVLSRSVSACSRHLTTPSGSPDGEAD